MRSTIKFAPKLEAIEEDLTASMMITKRKQERRDKTSLLNYRRTVKEQPKPTSSSGHGHSRHEITKSKSATDNHSTPEHGKATEAVHIALEPIVRHRADTAITAVPAAAATETTTENKYGRSILHDAVRKKNLIAVQQILATQPDLLRVADKRGNQPLHYAANVTTKRADEIVYCLLKAGAFVNATNHRQQTPLMIHVITNGADDDTITRILLHNSAKPRLKVTDSMLLSEYASSRGLHKIAAALCEYM